MTTNQKAIQILAVEIAHLDARLAEIEIELASCPNAGDRRAELQVEMSQLASMRRVADNKLKDERGDMPVEQLRRQKLAAIREAEIERRTEQIRQMCFETADAFARQGDQRAARQWRVESFKAREQAERELR